MTRSTLSFYPLIVLTSLVLAVVLVSPRPASADNSTITYNYTGPTYTSPPTTTTLQDPSWLLGSNITATATFYTADIPTAGGWVGVDPTQTTLSIDQGFKDATITSGTQANLTLDAPYITGTENAAGFDFNSSGSIIAWFLNDGISPYTINATSYGSLDLTTAYGAGAAPNEDFAYLGAPDGGTSEQASVDTSPSVVGQWEPACVPTPEPDIVALMLVGLGLICLMGLHRKFKGQIHTA